MGVTLAGFIDVPADRLAEIEAALPEHIRLTRAEPGCEHFAVDSDPTVAGRFNVSERFTDRSALEAHQQRARSSHWGRVSQGLQRSYRIEETGS